MGNKIYDDNFRSDWHRPQDDIPYEQMMKHIIEDYRRVRRQLDELAVYTKKLERDYENEKDMRVGKGEKNRRLGEKYTKVYRKYKRLYAYLEWLKEKYNITEDISEFSSCDEEEEQ